MAVQQNQWSVFLLVIFMCTFGWCQVPSSGNCPNNIKTVQDFNVDKYMGKWYEHSKYPFRFATGGKCIYAVYEKLENGTISVLNTQIKNSAFSSIAGIAETTDEPGKILVKFPPRPVNVKSNYWVLGTDYTNYVVVYSCSEQPEKSSHSTIVWILTRSRTPPKESIEAAHKLMDLYEISKSHLTVTDQIDCPPDQ